ncbi:MAG: selenide, water dikinase SelD [Bacteroidales bacterium]|nr:selenide, water dikinase SelD [Bacteroidales bacterium]
MDQIYLDYNATTPIDPEVASEMRPFLDEYFGNPSSSHTFGIKTRMAVERARSRIAALINCRPPEVIFTSGGTESNNMAIKGAAFAMRKHGNHIIISAVEHPAVTEVTRFLETQGFEITVVKVDKYGMIDPEDVKKALRPETILVSVMHANNEVGTIQPIAAIADIARRHGALMHTDAAQSLGKIPVDVKELDVDLLSVAGHKLYGPKGIGFLYIRHGVKIEKLMHGADHEQNLRAGTENVLEIVGLGKACEIAGNNLENNLIHLSQMKIRLLKGMTAKLGKLRVNGHPSRSLPNTLSIGFENLNAVSLLQAMEGVAASAGAACHTGTTGDSSVLGAMKVPPAFSQGTIRFSTGRYTTEDEIDRAVDIIANAVLSLNPETEDKAEYLQDGEAVKLTHFTHGLGCACKMRPADLEIVLANMPAVKDPRVLIGADKRDDAAVYRLNDEMALVQTVDFFTPVVDDPYTFGSIAAANSLSDIYAMGAKPIFALNIAAFPVNRLPLSVLEAILKGASDKAAEAGIPILGGHSIEDSEPKFGMVVSGLVHPGKVLSNAGAKKGDVLVLTKPLGTGIIATAAKRGIADEASLKSAIHIMQMLNKTAAEMMLKRKVNACTDISGFGLTGHLHELVSASGVDAEIWFDHLPFIEGVQSLAAAGAIPGGTIANTDFAASFTDFGSLSHSEIYLVCDAQTSGGLLVSLPPDEAELLLKDLTTKGMVAAIVGKLSGPGDGKIRFV